MLRRPGTVVLAAAAASRKPDPPAGSNPVLELKLDSGSPATAPASNPFLPATTQLREVAKWLIGAFAAVAAVMLAGTQLSSLGALSTQDPTRLVVAVAAAVIVVAATTAAIYQLSTVLPLDFSGMHGLVEESREAPMREVVNADSGYRAGRANVGALLADYEAARDRDRSAGRARAALALQVAATVEPSAELEAQLARATRQEELAEAEVKSLKEHVTALIQMKGYLNVCRRFDAARTAVLWLSAVAAAGIITFAWAANPPETKAATSAALAPRPVEARLVLTPAGAAELGTALGEECAQSAASSGTHVVVMSTDTETSDVVVLAEGSCARTMRLDVASRLGRLVPLDTVVVPASETTPG